MADIQKLLKEFENLSVIGNDCVSMNTKKGKRYDSGMAKLHALLNKENPTSVRSGFLRHAESKALSQQKYYCRATDFFTKPHDEGAFPFMALPAELRLLVYHELLVSNDRLVLTWRCPKKSSKLQRKIYIGILLSCKQCANEGAQVLYGQNLFDFEQIRMTINVGKTLLSRIGHTNFSLIRFIVAEYSAAAEELSHLLPVSSSGDPVSSIRSPKAYQLTIPFLIETFAAYNIYIDQLRLFAISIIPYGSDDATSQIMKIQLEKDPNYIHLFSNYEKVDKYNSWLGGKNDKIHLEGLVKGICEREQRLKIVDFERDIEKKLAFQWDPPFFNRLWIVYEKD